MGVNVNSLSVFNLMQVKGGESPAFMLDTGQQAAIPAGFLVAVENAGQGCSTLATDLCTSLSVPGRLHYCDSAQQQLPLTDLCHGIQTHFCCFGTGSEMSPQSPSLTGPLLFELASHPKPCLGMSPTSRSAKTRTRSPKHSVEDCDCLLGR